MLNKNLSYKDSHGVLEELAGAPPVITTSLMSMMNDVIDVEIPKIAELTSQKSLMAAFLPLAEPEGGTIPVTITLLAGETYNLSIDNFSYAFTNLSTEENNITYEYNYDTKILTITGGSYNLESLEEQNSNIIFNGVGNINANLGSGDNTIQINSGDSFNLIAGNGNNTVISEISAEITMGNGNNEISLNADNKNLNLGTGNNVFNINAENTTIISQGNEDILNILNNNLIVYNDFSLQDN